MLFKYEYEIESEVVSAEKYRIAISNEIGVPTFVPFNCDNPWDHRLTV